MFNLSHGKEFRLSSSEVSSSAAQIWKSRDFSVEVVEGEEQGSIIFRLKGPFTARDMHSSLSPDAFRKLFETQPAGAQVTSQSFDLSGVPYMDSLGMGLLAGLYVRARNKGVRWSVSGCTPRDLELLKLTKLDSVLPIVM
ncbi:STAS domain-containing protein [Occallatibacter riparius]|uniref:STAS domain-containing protein n=1 Tax=Occallatibacter riparius TaxID=1002689 RepID=UPI0036F2331E